MLVRFSPSFLQILMETTNKQTTVLLIKKAQGKHLYSYHTSFLQTEYSVHVRMKERRTQQNNQCCCVPCQVMSLQFVSIMSKGSWSMLLHQHQLQLSAYMHFTVKALHLLMGLEMWNAFLWTISLKELMLRNRYDAQLHWRKMSLQPAGPQWAMVMSTGLKMQSSSVAALFQVLTHHAKFRHKATSSCCLIGWICCEINTETKWWNIKLD